MLNAKVDKSSNEFAKLEANVTNGFAVIDQLKKELLAVDSLVEYHGTILTVFNSSLLSASSDIAVMYGRTEDLKQNQSLISDQLEFMKRFHDEMKSLHTISDNFMMKINSSVQENSARISTHEKRMQQERVLVDMMVNNSQAWNLAAENVESANEELKSVQEIVQGQGTKMQRMKADLNETTNWLQNFHKDLSWTVRHIQRDIDAFQNMTMQYLVRNDKQVSLIKSQADENSQGKTAIAIIQEQLQNITKDETDFEEELKNTSQAILNLARRIANQSSIIQLISEQNNIRGDQMKSRLDNVTLKMMQLDNRNDIRWDQVQLLESKYGNLFEKVANNSLEIFSINMENNELKSKFQKLDGSVVALKQTLSNTDEKVSALSQKIDKKSEGFGRSIENFNENFTNSIKNIRNSLGQDISVKFGEVKELAAKTKEIGMMQKVLGGKLLNLTRQVDSKSNNFSDKISHHDRELVELHKWLQNAIADVGIVNNFSQSLSLHVREIEENVSQVIGDYQMVTESSLEAMQAFLLKNVTTNSKRIDQLTKSAQHQTKTIASQGDLLINMTHDMQSLNGRLDSVAYVQKISVNNLRNATQNAERVLTNRIRSLSRTIQVLSQESHHQYLELTNHSAQLVKRQDTQEYAFGNERGKVVNLIKSVKGISDRLTDREMELTSMSRHLTDVNATLSDRLAYQAVNIKFLQGITSTTVANLTEVQSSLRINVKRQQDFEFQAMMMINMTHTKANQAAQTMFSTFSQNVNGQLGRFDSLIEDSAAIKMDLLFKQQQISSVVNDLKSVNSNLTSITNRQHYHDDLITMLRSVHNETEQQVELLSDQATRLHQQTIQCEQDGKRQSRNMTDIKNDLENVTTYVKLMREKLSGQRTTVERLRFRVADNNRAIMDFNSTYAMQQSSVSKMSGKLNEVDELLVQAINNFTESSLQRSNLISQIENKISGFEKSTVEEALHLDNISDEISTMKQHVQTVHDVISLSSKKLNMSTVRIAFVEEFSRNLSLANQIFNDTIEANKNALKRHSTMILGLDFSKNTLLGKVTSLNDSVLILNRFVNRLNDSQKRQNDVIEGMQYQNSNASSVLDQLVMLSNETLDSLKIVEEKTRNNKITIDSVRRNVTELDVKSMHALEMIAQNARGLEYVAGLAYRNLSQKYNEINLKHERLQGIVHNNSAQRTSSLSKIDHLQLSLIGVTNNFTKFSHQVEKDIREIVAENDAFQSNISYLKDNVRSNAEAVARDSLLLEVVEAEMASQRKTQKDKNNYFGDLLSSVNKSVVSLKTEFKDASVKQEMVDQLLEKLSNDMITLGRKIFDLHNETSHLVTTKERHAQKLSEQYILSQTIAAELDDVRRKVELLMRDALKNYTIDENNSSVLSFAQILSQLRSDVTKLNITAWNTLSRETPEVPSNAYADYGNEVEAGNVVGDIYADYSPGSGVNVNEMPYLLSNLTSVLQGIENAFYFVIPKTSEVILNLTKHHGLLEISLDSMSEEISHFRDAFSHHLVAYFKHRDLSDLQINNITTSIQVFGEDLTEIRRSLGKAEEAFGDRMDEINVDISDSYARITRLEKIIPFMESKQQNAIDMLWQFNETLNSLDNSEQSRNDRLDLMFSELLHIRQDVDEATSKVTKTEDSFDEFRNTSNRYRVSLWKDVLDIINSTVENVETKSEVLRLGGERRDMLLVNAEKVVRGLSKDIVWLKEVAQETKWNGNQIDLFLLNLDTFNTDNIIKFQTLENGLKNQTRDISALSSKIDAIHHTVATSSRIVSSEENGRQTGQATTAPTDVVVSPDELQVFNVDATRILVTWNASPTSGVTGYRIVLERAFNASALPIELQVQDTQAIFEHLQPDTAYTVKVYAEKNSVTSQPLTGVAVTGDESAVLNGKLSNETSTSQPDFTASPSEIIWQCNFEHVCDIYQSSQDDFDWEYYNGSTPSDETGPTRDHTTGKTDGTYLFIEASKPRQAGEVAKVATSLLGAEEDTCLEFFYHMYGVGTGALSVWLAIENQAQTKLWEKTGSQGNLWQKEVLPIQSDGRFMLVFEAERGVDYHSDIAIDDIVLKRGRCPRPLFECDFEDPSSCGFVQDDTDDIDWERTKGATPSSDTGPLVDHTLMTSEGHYMFMESSQPQNRNERARLISPEVRTNQKTCLQFFYHMHGIDIKEMSVYLIESMTNPRDKKIWSKLGPQGNTWNSGRINIPVMSRYRIVFEAVVGNGYYGDIGLDDVQISTGSCNSPVCTVGEPYGDFCYVINTAPSTFVDASSACEENEGFLAAIKTKEQHTFVKELVTNNTRPMERFWIGLNDIVREGHFVYPDRTPLVASRNSFNAWAATEPNDSDGSEDCVAIDILHKRRGWSDLSCDTQIGFVCQYPSVI